MPNLVQIEDTLRCAFACLSVFPISSGLIIDFGRQIRGKISFLMDFNPARPSYYVEFLLQGGEGKVTPGREHVKACGPAGGDGP